MNTGVSGSARREALMRVVGWIAVGSMLAIAALGPAVGSAEAAPLNGAVYTSNVDGSTINENIYAYKADVYLTGGPCSGGSHLPPGDYYFEIDSPNGVLLSSDPIGGREFTIGASGFILTTSGTHLTHAVTCSPPVIGITIQLLPFLDTPNPGGEYKLQVASAASVEACAGFAADSTTFQICQDADQKSDNFKVGALASPIVTEAPSTPPSSAPSSGQSAEPSSGTSASSGSPSAAPSGAHSSGRPSPEQSFSEGVLGVVATPRLTLPPTDRFGPAGSSSGAWRVVLIILAGVLATVLVVTPARSPLRRR